jgi:hypothetical protein
LFALTSCFGETTVKASDIIKKLEQGEAVADFAMLRTGSRAIFHYAKFTVTSTAGSTTGLRQWHCLRNRLLLLAIKTNAV